MRQRCRAPRFAAVLAAGLLLVLALLSACAPGPPGPSKSTEAQPNPASVVLVTIDTLRADRLRADGPMPRLWELADRGCRFTTAHTPVPLTLPAHATVLTGLGPHEHGVRDNIGYALSPDLPTVAESLAGKGWITAAFVAGYPLDRGFGLARGFDVYDDRMTRTPEGRKDHTERRAGQVVDATLAWLEQADGRPFFLWVHLFDPHDPYEAPPPFAGRHDHPYDDEVAYTDHELGRLLDTLDSREAGRPWIVVASDHGEALGDHGEPTHGVLLYESTLRVPLVIAPPIGISNCVVDDPVSLADLAKTLREAAGLDPSEFGGGRSLVPLLSANETRAAPATRPLFVESIHGRRRFGWAPLAGFVEWPEKYIEAPQPELYDLSRDPAERNNLFTAEREERLQTRLVRARESGVARASVTELDQADLAKLASLGYVGTSGVALADEDLHDRPRPDPKERIQALSAVDRGRAAMAAGRIQEALRALEEALSIDPENLVALNDLGLIALRSGRVTAAVGYFQRGIDLDGNAETLANNLGLALGGLGRDVEAEQAFRRALEIRPGFTMARFNLGFVLHRQGEHREALEQLSRVRSEEPEFPGLEQQLRQVRLALDAPRDR